MQLLIRLLITTIAVLITDLLLPGVSLGDMSNTNGLITALLVAVVLGLLNTFLKPLLILFTLPATLLTMGLFLLVNQLGHRDARRPHRGRLRSERMVVGAGVQCVLEHRARLSSGAGQAEARRGAELSSTDQHTKAGPTGPALT